MGYLKQYFGIGSMDRQVKIEEDVFGIDPDFNTDVVMGKNEHSIWAAKLNKRGDETHISDKETNKKTVEWIIRYHGITPNAKMRLERKNNGESQQKTPRSRSQEFPSLREEMDWWKCRSRSLLLDPSRISKNYGRNQRGRVW